MQSSLCVKIVYGHGMHHFSAGGNVFDQMAALQTVAHACGESAHQPADVIFGQLALLLNANPLRLGRACACDENHHHTHQLPALSQHSQSTPAARQARSQHPRCQAPTQHVRTYVRRPSGAQSQPTRYSTTMSQHPPPFLRHAREARRVRSQRLRTYVRTPGTPGTSSTPRTFVRK